MDNVSLASTALTLEFLVQHPAHKAHLVREYLSFINLEVIFLPTWSSTLNPVESFWNVFKGVFKKEVSGIRRLYDHDFFEADVHEIMRLTVQQTRYSALL